MRWTTDCYRYLRDQKTDLDVIDPAYYFDRRHLETLRERIRERFGEEITSNAIIGALDRLRKNPGLYKEQTRARAKQRSAGASTFDWSSEWFAIAANAFLVGKSISEIAAFIGCTEGQIAQCIYNNPPKFPFPVAASGPLSWTEAWQIGGTLAKANDQLPRRGWKWKTLSFLGADPKLRPPMPIDADPARIDALRAEYRRVCGLPGERPPNLGISLFITMAQKARLRERGFTMEQIRDMKPVDAHRLLGLHE